LRFVSFEPLLGDLGDINLDRLGWVIKGAQSGAGARPMQLDWVRNICDQCVAAGVLFSFEQGAVSGLPAHEARHRCRGSQACRDHASHLGHRR
jgi:protein gp37